MKKVVLIPRWAGAPSSDWYPWLATQLAQPPGCYAVQAVAMPHWHAPDVAESVAFLRRVLPPALLDANTLLVGHSVGCQLLLRYLAEAAAEAHHAGRPVPQVGGLVAVAGWFTVQNPWATLRPWLAPPPDPAGFFAAVRRTLPPNGLHLVLSDNDPHTPDHRANAHLWTTHLGAQVQLVAGQGHFNTPEAPDVLALIRAAAGH